MIHIVEELGPLQFNMTTPDLLPANENFVSEEYPDMVARYSGFGTKIFSILQERLPAVFEKLQFFRGIKYQPEDVYAIYDNRTHAFGIQLDPQCEVIVLWNKQIQTEIGAWSKDICEEAIGFIQTELLGPDK